VIPPGVALALANVGYGTMAGFVVLHLDDAGVGGGATAFTAFAAAVVLARLLAGRLPDVLGPRTTAIAAGAAETAGLGLLALAPSFPVALAGAIVMGCGFSLLFPSLALIAVSRVGGERRGAALGAFTAFFDAGVGLGAPLAGAVAALAGYPAAFWLAAGAALAGTVVAAGMDERGPLVQSRPAAA
jgi:MFS family permease